MALHGPALAECIPDTALLEAFQLSAAVDGSRG
jgi:hypothetical protein